MKDTKRQRRSKSDIERDINTAAEKLIGEKGFANVQLTEITREAGIEPVVFYNRWKNLDEFYDEFIKKYDYWVSDMIARQTQTEPSEQNCADILDGLAAEMESDSIMREILRWEIAQGNTMTERTAMMREMLNMQLVLKYKRLFRQGDSDVDIDAFAALMIGGIYYLFLHRDRSTFCGLDLNDPKDIAKLRNAIRQLTSLVFATLNH